MQKREIMDDCQQCVGHRPTCAVSQQVHRYHRPCLNPQNNPANPTGAFDRTLLTLQPDTGNPWDVKASRDRLFVSVHNGGGGGGAGRIVILDVDSGEQLRCVGGDASLSQPNMLALE